LLDVERRGRRRKQKGREGDQSSIRNMIGLVPSRPKVKCVSFTWNQPEQRKRTVRIDRGINGKENHPTLLAAERNGFRKTLERKGMGGERAKGNVDRKRLVSSFEGLKNTCKEKGKPSTLRGLKSKERGGKGRKAKPETEVGTTPGADTA